MDPGSSAALVADPRGALSRLEARVDVRFAHIAEAVAHTAQQFERTSSALDREGLAPEPSIVLFGSWARGELTDGSDNDWAVLASRPFSVDDPDIARAVALAQAHLGQEGRQPGSQDVFGVPFDVAALVERIGLDADSNRNLTRRMLLLLESRELCGSVHAQCWSRVLARYLQFGIKNNRPPRFLLNDLARYWRTVCVDFEGKHGEGGVDDPKWVTRNAKLRTSRKLLFAGGLLPILLCHLRQADEMHAFLTTWLTATPADRLAAAFLHYEAVDEGARTFAAYDRWIAIAQDAGARSELTMLRASTRDQSELWHEIRSIGEELQRGLTALLFDTALRPLATHYVIF